MARKKSSSAETTEPSPVKSYRYPSKRKNNPRAGLAAQGKIRETPKLKFAYDPHLPPVLRFDATGASDKLPELLQTARSRALTAEEAQQLTEALRRYEPWLEWAGKREKKEFEVDPVALHQALGYGKNVKTAFDLRCVQIDMQSLNEQDTPKLLATKCDPKKLYLFRP